MVSKRTDNTFRTDDGSDHSSNSSITSNNSFERTRFHDQQKAEELKKKGPDILTGNGYDSQIYRGRLDKRDQRSQWKKFSGKGDTREKLVKEVSDKFEGLFNKLREFAEKYPVSTRNVVGRGNLTFIGNLQYDKEQFENYKAEALKGTTTRKNQMFDRMLAHLDLLQSYEQKTVEQKKQNEGNESLKENTSRLDKASLDKVYKALEYNYKHFYETLQKKNAEGSEQIDLEQASRDFYRAFIIIEDQTHQIINVTLDALPILDVGAGKTLMIGDKIRNSEHIQQVTGKKGKDNVVQMARVERLQKGLEMLNMDKEQAQKLALEHDADWHSYHTDKRFLVNIVGLYGEELEKKLKDDWKWEKDYKVKIENASSSVEEGSKKMFAFGEQITQLLTKSEEGGEGKEKANDPQNPEFWRVTESSSSSKAKESETTFGITDANDLEFFKQPNIWDKEVGS